MRPSILFHLSARNKKSSLNKGEFPPEWRTIYYKKYPRLPKIILPEPHWLFMPLSETLLKRESGRNFNIGEPISLEQISSFLYWSAGIRDKNNKSSKRMYPSGGARYPIEIYPVIFRAEGFEKGIYHYAPLDHSLEKIADESWLDEAKETLAQEEIKDSAAIFIMTAVFERTMMKYQEFGYRLIMEEAGHLCQNFYLTAAAMELAGCGLGGFNDKLVNKLLDIDGINEGVVYVFALGHK